MPNNDHIWPDPLDIRVAKHAFTITFRPTSTPNPNPASSADSAAAAADDGNNLSATITTGTTKHIWVNDVQLTQRKEDRPLYGYLRTGDTVMVFHPLLGSKGRDGKESEMLKFRVEVNVGRGKEPRREEGDEPFTVLEAKAEEAKGGRSEKKGKGKERAAVAGKKEEKGSAGNAGGEAVVGGSGDAAAGVPAVGKE
ncbi:MAG: hypothetical protein Q9173_007371 [Seirophora scorigena]